jgi:hypothetical protein
VVIALPPDGSAAVELSSNVALVMNRQIDPLTVTTDALSLSAGGIKLAGSVALSADGMTVSFDPDAALVADTEYTVELSDALTDAFGNPAQPFSSAFHTTVSTSSGTIGAGDIGGDEGGATIGGANADDGSGFSVAAVGDADADGIGDVVIGSPNFDAGFVDAGRATLLFGATDLQSGTALTLDYDGEENEGFAGRVVARGGDLNADGVDDFLVGAPQSDAAGVDSGSVYVIFGDPQLSTIAPSTVILSELALCATATRCGVKLTGSSVNENAGYSVSAAGDPNDDGDDDLLIGAPGWNGGVGAVYLVFGPLAAGEIDLGQVGITVPGLVFPGEDLGDRVGEAVGRWGDQLGDGIDDMLIAAPGATPLDDSGIPVPTAGYVYAIFGSPLNLVEDPNDPGVIELSRVANGLEDEVLGIVFLGDVAGGEVGRSITGEVDIDFDGQDDIVIGADAEVWAINGDDPKTVTGSSKLTTKQQSGGSLSRPPDSPSAADAFGAVLFSGGSGGLVVAPGGDVNNDGVEDLVIGEPTADPGGLTDAGVVYIVLGNPALTGREEVVLEEIGTTEAGFQVEGAEMGDMLGSGVSGDFDLNGDGIDDIVAGAPFADSQPGTPENAGESYIISPVAPAEVVSLRLSYSSDVTTLEWTVAENAVDYNVYRGLVSALAIAGQARTTDMTQLACGINTDANMNSLPDTTDGDPAPVADVHTYLVTANSGAGEGPIGPGRLNDGACP